MCAPGWILLVQLHGDLPGAKELIATLPQVWDVEDPPVF